MLEVGSGFYDLGVLCEWVFLNGNVVVQDVVFWELFVDKVYFK